MFKNALSSFLFFLLRFMEWVRLRLRLPRRLLILSRQFLLVLGLGRLRRSPLILSSILRSRWTSVLQIYCRS